MVTSKVIESLYKTYRKRPSAPDELNIGLLFDPNIQKYHQISLTPDELVIGSIPEMSPFHTILLRHIHGIVEFDRSISIVLHSSIIFLNKRDNGVNLHIKMEKPSFMDRLRGMVDK